MSGKRYKACRYRIVFNIHDDSDTSSTVGNNDSKHQLKYTLSLTRSQCCASSTEKNQASTNHSKASLKTQVYKLNSHQKCPTRDTLSSDTFYSCSSSLSVQDKTSMSKHNSAKVKVLETSDEGSVDQITIVNQIYLTNSSSDQTCETKSLRPQVGEKKVVNFIRTNKSKDKLTYDPLTSKIGGISRKGELGKTDKGVTPISKRMSKTRGKKEKLTRELIIIPKPKRPLFIPITDNGFERSVTYLKNESLEKPIYSLPACVENKLQTVPFLGTSFGEGDFSNENSISDKTVAVCRETIFLKSLNESNLMMLVKNTANNVQSQCTNSVLNCFRAADLETEKPSQKLTEVHSFVLQEQENISENTSGESCPATKEIVDQSVLKSTASKRFTAPCTLEPIENDSDEEADQARAVIEDRLGKYCNFKTALPVIEEESGESINTDLEENIITEDYYLVDSDEKPIHLFNSSGLPLTDHFGRPLKDTKGNVLMSCDENGIPIVDLDDCEIFDMFGNRPNEENFDPTVYPLEEVCNKLTTRDGKPLLLFDVEGRPLTTVSGTLLVDCSGKSLIGLNDL